MSKFLILRDIYDLHLEPTAKQLWLLDWPMPYKMWEEGCLKILNLLIALENEV
jgi:hypothetical protein